LPVSLVFSILCLVAILPVSLVYPSCVLSQYCRCLWFDHSEYCPNNACGSGVFILCLLPILSVSLICPSYVLSQCYLFLWFVNSESCFNAACASD
jgi:hypothetical protein